MARGDFTRLQCIGTGSFGKVWLVQYTANNRKYVLKEVQIKGMTDKEIEQAVTEVKVLSHLGHFNIVRYKQAFVKDKSLNIIMEYADGGDLHSKIQEANDTPFDENTVLSWFIQIAFALKYIHKENILHRDLKTQNIFITSENVIKVGDFGIAKVLASESGIAETAIGTPYYLSPEICQSKPYNKKSDIWALGCILYEIATLKHAFESSTFNNLLMKIVHGEHGKLPGHYPFHPISCMIEMMLQHEADDRPTVDQILRLPSLRPHITKYEQMALKLIEGRQSRRFSVPGKRAYKQSLSEDANVSLPKIAMKKRSQSVDSGKKVRGDLRKAVILKQALTRRSSSLYGSTYTLTSPSSPELNHVEGEDNPSGCTEDDDKGVDEVFVEDLPAEKILGSDIDVLAYAYWSSSEGDSKQAITSVTNHLSEKLGKGSADQLIVTVNDHMKNKSDEHASSMGRLKEMLSEQQLEAIHLAMLRWFLEQTPKSRDI